MLCGRRSQKKKHETLGSVLFLLFARTGENYALLYQIGLSPLPAAAAALKRITTVWSV
jgi:hypothetical protein